MNAALDRLARRLPGVVRRNFRLKALAFGLAVVAWTVVVYASNPPDTRTVDVDVPTDNLPSQFILTPAPGPVAVRVRGTTEHLNDFSPSSLRVSAAFDRVSHTGQQDVPLTVTNTDRNVELDSAPASVGVYVDALDSRTLAVQIVPAQRNGKALSPPPGYIIGDTTASPATVTVTGSRHRLDTINGLHAEADVDLSNARTTYAAQEDVTLRDKAGTAITDLSVSPPSVQVHIVITSNTVQRASPIVPDLIGTAGFGRVLTTITISPQPYAILTGPQDLLNTLNKVSTDPIRLVGLFSGQKVTVKVVVPAGVTADPATVDVTVFFSLLPPPTPTPTALPSPTPTPSPSPTAVPPPGTPTPAPPTPTPSP